MADQRQQAPPAMPFTGERARTANIRDLDAAEEILGEADEPVYQVNVTQWGHDEHHWRRGDLLRESDLRPPYRWEDALAKGILVAVPADVQARFLSGGGKRAAARAAKAAEAEIAEAQKAAAAAADESGNTRPVAEPGDSTATREAKAREDAKQSTGHMDPEALERAQRQSQTRGK